MRSVMISIKPYWVFLIIAKTMGWNVDEEKTVEVRKSFPKDEDWNEVVKIYCTRDKQSFAKIPKEYQPCMEKFLGKVIGEFVCDNIDTYDDDTIFTFRYEDYAKWNDFNLDRACIHPEDFQNYANGKWLYGWHISDFVIYDKPKDLCDFMPSCKYLNDDGSCQWEKIDCDCQKTDFNPDYSVNLVKCLSQMTRPPQSWCYCEEG